MLIIKIRTEATWPWVGENLGVKHSEELWCQAFHTEILLVCGPKHSGLQTGGNLLTLDMTQRCSQAMPSRSVLWRRQLRTHGSPQMYAEETATPQKGGTMHDPQVGTPHHEPLTTKT